MTLAMVAFMVVGLFACVLINLFVHEDDREHVVLLAAVIVAVSIRACVGGLAHAQPRESDLEMLVRITAHEAGLDSPDDVDGIAAVIRNGAMRHDMSFAAFARAYSPTFFARQRPHDANMWTRDLALDCSRPRGFRWRWDEPRGALPSRADACRVLVERARAALAAPTPACDATDWGSRRDHERARLTGRRFRLVSCGGDARNLFSVRLPHQAH